MQDSEEYRVRVKGPEQREEVGVATHWGETSDGEPIYGVVFGEPPHRKKLLVRVSQLEFLDE